MEITIDGGIYEAGGQIVRVSSPLSILLYLNELNKVILTNIRKYKPKPGINAQLAAGLSLISSISGADIQGSRIGSDEIVITKGYDDFNIQKDLTIDCGTAGSITLMIQISLPLSIYQNKSVNLTLIGGTDVSFAPPIDHTINVLFPQLSHMGLRYDLIDLPIKRGFYPIGGGKVSLKIYKISDVLNPIDKTIQGDITKITCYIATTLSNELIDNVKKEIKRNLRNNLHINQQIGREIPLDIYIDNSSSKPTNQNRKKSNRNSPNYVTSIQVCIETSTSCILSSNRLITTQEDISPIDNSIDEIVIDLNLLLDSKSCIDEYTADQLLIFMALANGISKLLVEPISNHSSEHIITTIYVIDKILIDSNRSTGSIFLIETLDSGCRLITCHGIGYKPNFNN